MGLNGASGVTDGVSANCGDSASLANGSGEGIRGDSLASGPLLSSGLIPS